MESKVVEDATVVAIAHINLMLIQMEQQLEENKRRLEEIKEDLHKIADYSDQVVKTCIF